MKAGGDTRRRILAVDDDIEILSMMTQSLRAKGYTVASATNGEDALIQFHLQPAPLVITDVAMPRLDGIGLLKQIKGLYSSTMFLMVTAFGGMDTAVKAMKAGAENVLAKPFDMELLVVEVDRLFATLRLRREKEELANLVDMKNKFITLTNHEFRTPLSIIQGGVALLKREKAAPSCINANEVLAMMERASDRLEEIVDRFHDLETLNYSWLPLEVTEFDIEEEARLLLRVVSTETAARRIKLELAGAMAKPIISQDRSRLAQVLLELIQNAVKFTPDGGSVRVGMVRTGEPEEVAITITDTGIGIQSEYLGFLPEPFFVTEDVRRHSTSDWGFMGGGIGIGLARAKLLLESIGGTMTAQSEEGKGTVFTIRFPANMKNPNTTGGSAKASGEDAARAAGTMSL